MKKTKFLLIACMVLLALSRCTNSNPPAESVALADTLVADPAHSSENAPDWTGTYRGTLPCADCEGVETTISLSREKTYTRSLVFNGKNTEPFSESGTFSFADDGNTLILNAAEGNRKYKVGENVLIHLDNDGNLITGELSESYRLVKSMMSDSLIEGKRWNLIELMGKPIEVNQKSTGVFMELHTHDSRIVGNTGCNNFFGQYQLLGMGRIHFGKIGATLMACPDMTAEESFLITLEQADNYTLVNGLLTLNKAKMAPLARFKSDN